MTNTETVGQRFIALISHLGISKNAFASSLDKTATVIQHLVEERNKPGFDLLCKVFEVYPNVSKDWLLQGVGPMLNAEEGPAYTSLEARAEHIQKEAPSPAVVTKAEKTASESVIAPESQETVPAPASSAAPTSVSQPTVPLTYAQAIAEPMPAPTTPVVTSTPDTGWQTALYSQQMAHQLAMAELRNQHLQEQQRLMQQMMDLMQRQITR